MLNSLNNLGSRPQKSPKIAQKPIGLNAIYSFFLIGMVYKKCFLVNPLLYCFIAFVIQILAQFLIYCSHNTFIKKDYIRYVVIIFGNPWTWWEHCVLSELPKMKTKKGSPQFWKFLKNVLIIFGTSGKPRKVEF